MSNILGNWGFMEYLLENVVLVKSINLNDIFFALKIVDDDGKPIMLCWKDNIHKSR